VVRFAVPVPLCVRACVKGRAGEEWQAGRHGMAEAVGRQAGSPLVAETVTSLGWLQIDHVHRPEGPAEQNVVALSHAMQAVSVVLKVKNALGRRCCAAGAGMCVNSRSCPCK